MIVDASAIVAIMMMEPGADELIDRLEAGTLKATHAVSVFEAATAVARIKNKSLVEAEQDVADFLGESGISLVPLGAGEAAGALKAAARYGRGHHPAKLNMGDCFSYSCAKLRGTTLLYKGDDFAKTDLG